MKAVGLVVATCAFLNAGGAVAALISVYEFNGSFDDSLGNGNPAMGGDGPLVVENAEAASFARGEWSWSRSAPPSTGLVLDVSPVLAANYSIGVRFKFEDVNGYRKVIDFKNASSDTGLYVLNGELNFYPVSTSAGAAIAPDTMVDLLLTRSSSNGVTGYINGQPQPQLRFIDTDSYAVAEGVGNAARFRFFQDDTLTSSEWSNGTVSEIRFWDHPLSASEVASAFAAIPEPSGVPCFASAVACSLLRRRMRQWEVTVAARL